MRRAAAAPAAACSRSPRPPARPPVQPALQASLNGLELAVAERYEHLKEKF